MTKNRLEEKVVLVSGADLGWAQTIAERVCREGAQVIVAGTPYDPLVDTVQSIQCNGGHAIAYFGDLSEEHHAKSCVRSAFDYFGKLDTLIHIFKTPGAHAKFESLSISQFDENFIKGMRSAFLMARFSTPALKNTEGSLVLCAQSKRESHSSSRILQVTNEAWLLSFIEGLSDDLAPHQVRANCIFLPEQIPEDEELLEELTDLPAYLCSEQSNLVTGAVFSAMIANQKVAAATGRRLKKAG